MALLAQQKQSTSPASLSRRLERLFARRPADEPAEASDDKSLNRSERERLSRAQREAWVAEELAGLWLVRDAKERERSEAFLRTLASPKWRFEELHADGTEVWRLPGTRIHTIMGSTIVDAPPSLVLALFASGDRVFTQFFPRIDRMFVSGRLDGTRGRATLCQAVFKLPNLVGPGSVPGLRPREMVWKQFVTFLRHTGNVLVTASTDDENERRPLVTRGTVRATLLNSGYYGHKLKGQERTRVYYVAQAHPGGAIPAFIVNMACSRQAANVSRLAELFANGRRPDF
jgi:hypothetical protein